MSVNVETRTYEMADAEQWLVEIMDTYGDRLTKLAYSYVRDWGTAQEVVQDVFLTCYKKRGSYEEIGYFKAWIYQITINRCKDVLRTAWVKRVVVNNSLFQFLNAQDRTPEQESVRQQANNELVENILSLPLKYRETILLYYYEELSIQEISDLLKMKANTVKTRLKRGREMLGDTLERGDFDEI
ncbi:MULTISPECIES: sigma-70 family RNA polymerase sigma factor [Planomicrobium]|uniref:sigma-70 family RNA polymerase sigma factor n=1 Tax=Planomicrobium TaxID=162291 RepID=UPI001E4B7AAE|nr:MULTISPECIES: sigma-70 family RNA polymerase sigma factor [Planomicrobium]